MKYIQYVPFIKIPEQYKSPSNEHNYIPENIFYAQQEGFKKLQKHIISQKEWVYENTKNKSLINSNNHLNLQWLMKKLNILDVKELTNMLSAEQMDSVCAAIFNIENNNEFIIGDDTGIGKGRILAAITRYTLFQKNYNVIFFTEGSHLFSDFWRDLTSLKVDSIVKPFILHGNATIYNNKNEKIVKNFKKTIIQEIINSKGNDFSYIEPKTNEKTTIQCNLIFTTYSQFNKEDTANEKIKLLSKYIKQGNKTICLFDEFHNSIGDSTTKEMKDTILKINKDKIIPIYSSATFLDDYSQIMSFKKMLHLSAKDFKIIQSLETNNSSLELKNQIAYYLTSEMMLLRREHESVQKINYQEIDDNYKKDLDNIITLYSKIIWELFNTYQIAEKLSTNYQEAKTLKNKWIALGSKINRLNKIILLLGKEKHLINKIEQTLQENKKVVIILDSTFESIINNVMEYEKQYLKDTPKNNNEFKHLNVKTLIQEMIFQVFSGNTGNKKNNINFFELNHSEFDNAYDKLMQTVSMFPDIDLSFIDNIRNYFHAKNINTLEISGRSYSIKKNDNDIYEKTSLSKEDKTLTTYKFNNDTNYNIIILSRSGSTGLSLHSYTEFQDQRVRKMFEPEITPRVKVRKQFFGRINRRKQVVKPEFESISSGLPFEKRIIALEEQKFRDMKAFIGSDYEINSLDYDYYNDDINILAQKYLFTHQKIAKQLGISLLSNEQFYFIDSMLKRSVLLDKKEQEVFFNYLDSGHDFYIKCINHYNQEIKKSFVEEVKFHKFHYLWSRNKNEIDITKLSNIEKLDTTLPVVFIASVFNEKQLNKNDTTILKETLLSNYHQFNQKKYLENVFNLSRHFNELYDNDDISLIKQNYQLMKELIIGKQIQFKMNGNKYGGYIEEIQVDSQFNDYSTHYLYKIRLINPIINNESNRVISETVLITGNVLLENIDFKIIDKKIDFSKYQRNNETIKQSMIYLVGNIFYINYLHQVLNIGEPVTIHKDINGVQKQFYALKLPNTYKIDTVLQLPILQQLPIVDLEILEKTIQNNPNKDIYTIDKNVAINYNKHPYDYKLNFWIVKIQDQLYYNDDVFTFMDKKNLGDVYKRDKNFIWFKLDSFAKYKKTIKNLFDNKFLVFTSNNDL